jgi:hypothetical protein
LRELSISLVFTAPGEHERRGERGDDDGKFEDFAGSHDRSASSIAARRLPIAIVAPRRDPPQDSP